jgi:hypothetical protein
MLIWSMVFVLIVGMFRVRSMGRMIGAILVSAVILGVSHMLFTELSAAAGVEVTAILNPDTYLQSGPIAWLALMVMPFGWLGPIISLNLMKDRTPQMEPQFS